MRIRTLVALLCGLTAAASTIAETISIGGQVQLRESSVDRPKRGSSMNEVEARFGAPSERHPTVGQPPITRWDYPGFSVFFEHDRVIHSVAIGRSPAAQPGSPSQPAPASQREQASQPEQPSPPAPQPSGPAAQPPQAAQPSQDTQPPSAEPPTAQASQTAQVSPAVQQQAIQPLVADPPIRADQPVDPAPAPSP